MRQVAQQSIGSAVLFGSVLALGLVGFFILINSHLVPRAEPDVTAQVEAHFAVGERP